MWRPASTSRSIPCDDHRQRGLNITGSVDRRSCSRSAMKRRPRSWSTAPSPPAAHDFFNLGGNNSSLTQIQVDSGGELTATTTPSTSTSSILVSGSILNSSDLTNDTFNLPIYRAVPGHGPLLANNQSFQDDQHHRRNHGQRPDPVLDPIGTVSTASLVYIFRATSPSSTGATLTVGTGKANVLIDPGDDHRQRGHEHRRRCVDRVRRPAMRRQPRSWSTAPSPPAAPTSNLGRQLRILHPPPGRLRRRAHRQHHTFNLNELILVKRQHLELGRPDQRHVQLADLRAVPGRALCWPTTRASRTIDIIAGTMASGQTLSLSRSARSRRPAWCTSSRATSPSVPEPR